MAYQIAQEILDQLPVSKRVKEQSREYVKDITYDGRNAVITARVRWDDRCGNGRNNFSITGDITFKGRRESDVAGCIHEEITKYFPELSHLIAFHLFDNQGPMYYIGNTTYQATEIPADTGKRFVYLKGAFKLNTLLGIFTIKEVEDLKKLFLPPLELELKVYEDSNARPADLEGARRCANWPDATLEQLRDPDALAARLPAMMAEFKKAIENLGFEY